MVPAMSHLVSSRPLASRPTGLATGRSACLALAVAIACVGALGVAACTSTGGTRAPAPQAAPAPVAPHPEIAWNRTLRVHELVGAPDHYLADGVYVRFRQGHWEAADDWAGPWHRAAPAEVPATLRTRYARGGSAGSSAPARPAP